MAPIANSARARVVGVTTQFRDLRAAGASFVPQRIALFGQGIGTYPTTKRQIFSALEGANLYGFGSPIHKCLQQLFPENGDGVGSIPVTVYPLAAGNGASAANGAITLSGAATRQFSGRVRIGGVLSDEFTIPNGTAAAAGAALVETAIDNVMDMPVSTTTSGAAVNLTSKFSASYANDLRIEILAPSTGTGITFAMNAMASGSGVPDVQTAIDQIGDVWETMIINAAAPIIDATTLDKISTFGTGRWDALIRKPLIAVTGTTETTAQTLITAANARRTDRTNVIMSVPDSQSTPWEIAARAVARMALVADNDPAREYARQKLTGIIPGSDANQWNYAQRDSLVKAGISTTILRDSVVEISDTVTLYHPMGDTTPAYRFVKTIVKLMQVINNINLIFDTEEWDGAPLIPDYQPTTNENARKPRTAVAEVNAMIDELARAAILSDPAASKLETRATINNQNSNRLDVKMTARVSGNANIRSIELNFGFFFGTLPVV